MYKGGVDVLHSRFQGTSASGPVFDPPHRWDAGTAARLQPGADRQVVNSTDLAVFAQDRVQPTSRFYVEIGGRLDRDGVIGLLQHDAARRGRRCC